MPPFKPLQSAAVRQITARITPTASSLHDSGVHRTSAPLRAASAPATPAAACGLRTAGPPVDAPLPPPSAPRVTVTQHTQAAFEALSASIQEVLGGLADKLPGVPWGDLAPEVEPYADSAEAEAQSQVAAVRATAVAREAVSQLGAVADGNTLLQFLKLRMQSEASGLQLADQLTDMANALRRSALRQQTHHADEANAHLARAMRYGRVEQALAPTLASVTSALNVGVVLMSTSVGPGLAMAATAVALGFVGGGLMEGARQGTRFDWMAACAGATVGAAVVPATHVVAMLAAASLNYGATAWSTGALFTQFESGFAAALQQMGTALYYAGRSNGKTNVALQGATAAVSAACQFTLIGLTGLITKKNIDAQTATLWSKMCAQTAKMAQNRGQESRNFLSLMQERHADAAEQALAMLKLHHQMAMRAIRARGR